MFERVLFKVIQSMLIMATAAMLGATLGWMEQSKQARQWAMEDWIHDNAKR